LTTSSGRVQKQSIVDAYLSIILDLAREANLRFEEAFVWQSYSGGVSA